MILPPNVKRLIQIAIEEDLGRGDATASMLLPTQSTSAEIFTREPCVVACIEVLPAIIAEASAQLRVDVLKNNGELAEAREPIARITGSAQDLVSLERIFLNFLQRTCGVATQARRFKDRFERGNTKIVDTRKTIPGWRYLDKQAIRQGGLSNHRFALDSGILVKENHIQAAGGIEAAMQKLQKPHLLKVQVEVQNLADARTAVHAGADLLLLDNFAAGELPEVIRTLRAEFPKVELEVSGGITESSLEDYVAAGPDYISIGALTHSVPAANLTMLFAGVDV